MGEKEGTPIVKTRRGAHEYHCGTFARRYYTDDSKTAKSNYDGPDFVFRNMVNSIANALDYYKNGNPTHIEYERDEDAIRKQIDANIKVVLAYK